MKIAIKKFTLMQILTILSIYNDFSQILMHFLQFYDILHHFTRNYHIFVKNPWKVAQTSKFYESARKVSIFDKNIDIYQSFLIIDQCLTRELHID